MDARRIEHRVADSLESIAKSARGIDESLEKLVECFHQHLGSFSIKHGPVPQEETSMQLASFRRHGAAKAAGATPALKGDNVSLGGLLQSNGTPYTGPAPVWTAVSRDPAILTTGTVVVPGAEPSSAAGYPETFVAAGTVIVDITATVKGGNPDGSDTVVTQQDSVVLAPAPGVLGSFTVTHSL